MVKTKRIPRAGCRDSNIVGRFPRPSCRHHASLAGRVAIAICTLIPAFAVSGTAAEPESVNDFYITITANDLYLCGEGFGGLYGCIDAAVSREAKSVVISASTEASSTSKSATKATSPPS